MAQQGVRVLVAHDFDRSGACIAWTLGNDTRRYGFEVAPEVVDLGLKLAEARNMNLPDETAAAGGPGEEALRGYGLDDDEIEFLIRQRRRVELNAMTSDQFVAWLEGKLEEHGKDKVIPADGVLERHARRIVARRLAAGRVATLARELEAEVSRTVLPGGLATLVGREMERSPELPWEDALASILGDVTPEAGA
jgi:hypothetical protein